MKNYRVSTNIQRFFIYLFLTILLIIVILPIWLLIVNGTRSTVEIQNGISLIPSKYMVTNYKILLSKGLDLPRGFFNSFYISAMTTVVSVYFSLMTAYGLVVYKFRGRKLLYNGILVLVMIPMQLSIIGFYQYMSKLGLADSYWSLILPSIASAGAVFFGKQYLESVVLQDLIDAGRIDGASELGIFHRIMLPIAAPGAFTMGIFAFVGAWNNFFNAFILITSRQKYTLPMLIQTLRGDVYRPEYGAIYLGLAASVIPIIIIYFLFSRYIVNGISMGAVKE
ncbi:carbohydrate ABC transporter permease [Levilinea saccharolytica]|jgi:multiple sugar transport system permease protein|uniref:ABC transporter permease n=1 Tax=Levilinea saccharolytica TaxID=229921 RepID=A0A0N8GPF1_9CHLR|nr:carbohydrate ABC transporter permease [Levilinea saccharolytica]KPL80722.1 ABC transporter permease [Levilinea saccharolytica]GAP17205.1 ABC-type sugar transport system, permease component [Levilinea saccharolytica]